MRLLEEVVKVMLKSQVQAQGTVAHKMPESASALWRMVSLTAAKTRRMFDVSVAWVRLKNISQHAAMSYVVEVGTHCGYRLRWARLT